MTRFRDRIAAGEALRATRIHNYREYRDLEQEFKRWSHANRRLLNDIRSGVAYSRPRNPAPGSRSTLNDQIKQLRHTITAHIDVLIMARDRLLSERAAGGSSDTPTEIKPARRRVFLVHGHDNARDTINSFLSSQNIDPIILVEKPGAFRSIIEKFDDYADVEYAIVILTPDDVGRLADGTTRKLKGRARQNVILELGFFMGKLGRSRVCGVQKGVVEMPSDLGGIQMIDLKDKDWMIKLGRELREAGFDVNLNAVL
jgi:predicted nucleotide-binding protein